MLPFGAAGVPAGRHDGRGDPDLWLLPWRKSVQHPGSGPAGGHEPQVIYHFTSQ